VIVFCRAAWEILIFGWRGRGSPAADVSAACPGFLLGMLACGAPGGLAVGCG
jgi:hypothetical protein